MIREPRFTEDVAELPTHKFGPSSLTWWGIMAYMIVEGSAFAMAFAAYFFLIGHEQGWPPEARAAPDVLAGTLFTILILLSEIPNTMIKHAAEKYDVDKIRALMPVIVPEVAVGVAVGLTGMPVVGVKVRVGVRVTVRVRVIVEVSVVV